MFSRIKESELNLKTKGWFQADWAYGRRVRLKNLFNGLFRLSIIRPEMVDKKNILSFLELKIPYVLGYKALYKPHGHLLLYLLENNDRPILINYPR